MFSITNPVIYSTKKVAKKFKKFGKRMARERQLDLERYGQRLKDIALEERRRTRELFREHKEFFEKSVPEQKSASQSIDFFEK